MVVAQHPAAAGLPWSGAGKGREGQGRAGEAMPGRGCQGGVRLSSRFSSGSQACQVGTSQPASQSTKQSVNQSAIAEARNQSVACRRGRCFGPCACTGTHALERCLPSLVAPCGCIASKHSPPPSSFALPASCRPPTSTAVAPCWDNQTLERGTTFHILSTECVSAFCVRRDPASPAAIYLDFLQVGLEVADLFQAVPSHKTDPGSSGRANLITTV